MDVTARPASTYRTLTAVAIVGSAIWIVLALRRPDLTYHFAPLVAALTGSAAMRRHGRQPKRQAYIGGAILFSAIAVVALTLWATDNLRGPTFWSDDGSVVEAIAFAAIGTAIGLRVATRPKPGLIGAMVGANE